jgi:hypothetical protein
VRRTNVEPTVGTFRTGCRPPTYCKGPNIRSGTVARPQGAAWDADRQD